MISVNQNALTVVKDLIENREFYCVDVQKLDDGSTLIDAGIRAKGGFAAGLKVTKICLGGLCRAHLNLVEYGAFALPSISVSTDYPAIAALGSQFAGWRIKVGDYFAMGSGPARALSLKPKELYEKIDYKDESESAVILLETSARPNEEVTAFISDNTGVSPKNLYVVLTPTSSVVGSVQISGRVVETGLHKLTEVGFDPKLVLSGCGFAPIAPVHPKMTEAMGRTNDMILYGGVTSYIVDADSDGEVEEAVRKVPSSESKDYGRPFAEIFKAAGGDFYKIDPNLFAPAAITVNNARTGRSFTAGKVNVQIIKKSIGIS